MAIRQSLPQSSLISLIPDAYKKIDAWPTYDSEQLSGSDRTRFNKLFKSLDLLLSLQPLSEIEKVLPVSRRRFGELLRRAMTLKSDGSRVRGLEVFARHKSQSKRGRQRPLKPSAVATAGFGGMFTHVLGRFPNIEAGLCDFLNSQLRPNRTKGHVLHAEFLRLCAVEGLGTADYPLVTKSQGRPALAGWYKKRYLPTYAKRHIKREYGPDAAKALSYADGDGEAFTQSELMQDWVLDEQAFDLNARFRLPSLYGDWEELDLQRFEILRLRPVSFDVTLAWRLVLSKRASAEDIGILFWEAVSGPPKAFAAVPGLDYEPGAGYLANVFPVLRFQVPRVVWIDNALAHLADFLQDLVHRLWGGETRLGNPATPKERAAMESSIRGHTMHIVQQLPGTKGSHPRDPLRKAAAVAPEFQVEIEPLAHTLDVYFANRHVHASDSAGAIAPFTRIERLLAAKKIEFNSLPAHHRRPHWFSQAVNRPVCADLAKGRPAHVNFLYTRYSSDTLKRRYDLHNRSIFLRPDNRNLQHILAFDEKHMEIGMLTAEGVWGRIPHDVRIRKIFGVHRKAGLLGPRADDQPLQCLYAFLRGGAKTDSRLALQLAHVIRYLTLNVDPAILQEMEISMQGAEGRRTSANDSAAGSASALTWSEVQQAAATARAATPQSPAPASASPSHAPGLRVPRAIPR